MVVNALMFCIQFYMYMRWVFELNGPLTRSFKVILGLHFVDKGIAQLHLKYSLYTYAICWTLELKNIYSWERRLGTGLGMTQEQYSPSCTNGWPTLVHVHVYLLYDLRLSSCLNIHYVTINHYVVMWQYQMWNLIGWKYGNNYSWQYQTWNLIGWMSYDYGNN